MTESIDAQEAQLIVDEINAAMVAWAFDTGQTWDKKNWDVLIPEEKFKKLRRYHEWEWRPQPPWDQHAKNEQVILLPKCNVRNGGLDQATRLKGRGDYFTFNRKSFVPDPHTRRNAIYTVDYSTLKKGDLE